MTSLVLARKYRPRNFEQLVGQDHVVRALTHALQVGRLHHAYLFTGTRGVGKTTLSRILAKALNCVGPDGQGGITPAPCGVCEACRAIDAGRFVDYVEMDAASNRGVDEMAALLERAIYAPTSARFKVFMLDEVHMLTGHAFNAMLKTLEEPPEHIKFILATTDPHKVPVTVLSRCLQFNLKQMPPTRIVEHLAQVLGAEQVPFEANALRLIAQGAHGSMRDALSLTDQAIAYAGGEITESTVRGMLGTVDTDWIVRIADALLAGDGRALVDLANQIDERSSSFAQTLHDLALLFQRVALAQRVPDSIDDELPEAADVRRFAQAFDPQEAQLHYQIAITGRHELPLAPDEHAGFTMTLLRMLAFRPLVAAPDAAPAPPAPPAPATRGERAAPPAPAALTASASTPSTTPSTAPSIAFDGDWPGLVARLELRGLARETARHSELARLEGTTFHLRVADPMFGDRTHLDKLRDALARHFDVAVRVTIERGVASDTAAARASADTAARQHAAERAFASDPLVRTLIDRYGGSVVPGSIRPLDDSR